MTAEEIDVRPSEESSEDESIEDLSLGQLVGRVTQDLSQLFRNEVTLAKTELKEEAAQAGKGVAMLVGAGIAGLFTLLLLSFAGAWALADIVATGVAFVIVAGAWLFLALVLFLVGRRRLADAKPFPPQKTVETLKEDVQWVKDQMR